MNEKIWYLKRCPLFERLTPDEHVRLERASLARTFRKQQIVYFPHEPGESVLVMARGRVKIKAMSPDGRETIFAFMEPGEIFGELAILDGEPRNEYAEAVEESLVLALPREELLWLMQRRSDVALHVTKLIGFRLRRVENRLKNLLFRSTRERAISLLVELVDSHGRLAGDRWEIHMRLSHQELASLIGSTRETMTATLGQLQREGLIEIFRRRITVLKPDKLRAEMKGERARERTLPATPTLTGAGRPR
jgi:CRP/FNR family transcriptional regulator, cyclic AMP receptor protein